MNKFDFSDKFQITDDSLKLFRKLIYDKTGIHFPDEKEYLLKLTF